MFDYFLYLLWLRLSARWYAYRLTGMNPESGRAEIITFATEDFNIESMIQKLREDGNEVT